MSKGCPVLSSDRSSLPEVLGAAALYFNPEDADDFLTKVNLLLSDANLRDDLIARGRTQAKKYSWWQCAQETLTVYRQILRV
jgi:glycosyltransferase involved in cell wall biosynthesis